MMKYPERSHDLTSLCMHYVLLLRSIAFWGHAIILWFLTYLLDESFPILSVSLVLFALGLITFTSWKWAKKKNTITDKFVFLQLLVDVLTLSCLLYFTGGSFNPFVFLFMLPVTFAAAMLRPHFLWFIAGTAMICYTFLMHFYQPLMLWQHQGQGFALHIWGMWAAFLLSAGLVAYFVSRIGKTLKERDQLLAQVREQTLESEKIVALGALAAGTAHELGTPLATIAILSNDLEKATAEENPRISQKLGLLRGQVSRCKDILSRMADSTGESRADSGEPVSIENYLEEILREWLKTRPEVSSESHFSGSQPTPEIIADRTVTHAILNMLNNAADASNDNLQIEGHWDSETLTIKIQDKGTGLPVGFEDKIGNEPFLSTKPPGKGLGLGLYLAKTTLTRLGGDVHLENRKNTDGKITGVTAILSLPLTQLKLNE